MWKPHGSGEGQMTQGAEIYKAAANDKKGFTVKEGNRMKGMKVLFS